MRKYILIQQRATWKCNVNLVPQHNRLDSEMHFRGALTDCSSNELIIVFFCLRPGSCAWLRSVLSSHGDRQGELPEACAQYLAAARQHCSGHRDHAPILNVGVRKDE